MNYTITITRQFGSLGRPIAREIADALKIHYYDRDIVEQVSQKLHYPVRLISDEEERAKTKFWRMKYPLGRGTTARQDEIFAVERDIITDIARTESSVIVGRCSDYILKNAEIPCLNVLIHADMPHRITRVLERYGDITNVDVRKRIQKKDKQRRTYYRYYTDQQWGAYTNYDLALDSGVLGEDTCVHLICELAEKMSKENQ